MGVPLLFTDASGTPTKTVVPYEGLFPGDVFPSGQLFPNEGPTLDFYVTPPAVSAFGVTVSVDPAPVTFDATAPTFNIVDVTVAVDPLPVTFDATAPDVAGQNLVVQVDPGVVTFSAEVPGTSGGQLIILVPSVRELPPLRLHLDVETPNGRHFRWGEDEPNPVNVPSGLRFSDTMPGGFENQDCTLPRKPDVDYSDLERLSTVTIYGAGGQVAGEYRLERAPRVSGDQMSVSPSAVGWQALLDDDKSVTEMYIDRDLSHWRGPSVTRQLGLNAARYASSDPSTEADATTGAPGLKLSFSGAWVAPNLPVSEAFFDAGPNTKVAGVWYTPTYAGFVNTTDANWSLQAYVQDGDGQGTTDVSGDVFPATGQQAFFPTPRRFVALQWLYNATPAGGDGAEFSVFASNVAVVGDQGMPIRTDGATGGFFASDIVYNVVGQHAPLLWAAPDRTIQQSGFVIPHMVFREPTTPAEVIRQVSRFGLQDWGVWDNRTFWWHDRGAHGRKWRARVGPAQLEETGPQVDRLWESVIVQYSDVDGSPRTVGPPGSGADVEDPVLKDNDPDNPANRLGIVRRDLLQMSGTSTPAEATEVGRRFLEESRLLDSSGRARFVGHVESDRGVLFPYWAVRAGDYVSFVDASDPSPRRIVRSDKDHSSRTCSVDLDSPPEGLKALLERLGVVLVPLGIN